jgi:1,2-diacylglycerol-3-alpha-glucose alpha-1,2-glucosyltransferase
VNTDKFRFDEDKRDAFRRRYALDRPTVLCTGQVIPRKGIEDFFEVARLLPDLTFVWVGTRVNRFLFYSPRFERLLQHHPKNVRFTGFIEDVTAAYSGSDLFFFPSHAESLGLVILEAAVTGLPIVVRRLPVYQDWLQEGKNCLMGADPEEFKEAIMRLLSEHPPSLSANGLAEKHGLAQVGTDLVAAYQEVL